MNLFRFALSCLVYTGTLCAAPSADASTDRSVKAFDGAEGFGAYTAGGRGGTVLKVTNLTDDGRQGSLRWAVEQSGPRIVDFDVAGTIELTKPLVITNPFITIDGSTAPGIGITLKDNTLEINASHDVIVRHLRIRPGDEAILKLPTKSRAGQDGIAVADSSYVMIDHCSISWTSDTIASIASSDHVTMQWCFFYEPLANPEVHFEGGKPKSHAHISNVNGNYLSYIKNVLAYYGSHGLQVDDGEAGSIEVINNYCYGYDSAGFRLKPVSANKIAWHMVGNLCERSLGKQQPDIQLVTGGASSPKIGKKSKIYLLNNIGPKRTDPASDQWAGTTSDFKSSDTARLRSDSPLFTSQVQVIPTAQLKAALLERGGATLPKRDSNDLRVVSQFKTGQGKTVVNSQNDVGGYREFAP